MTAYASMSEGDALRARLFDHTHAVLFAMPYKSQRVDRWDENVLSCVVVFVVVVVADDVAFFSPISCCILHSLAF